MLPELKRGNYEQNWWAQSYFPESTLYVSVKTAVKEVLLIKQRIDGYSLIMSERICRESCISLINLDKYNLNFLVSE